MDFKAKTAVITGASSGIGLAYAEEFAKRGSNLVLVARSKDALEKLGAALEKTHGVRVHVVPQDLSQVSAGSELMAKLEKLGVSTDILVNNAGFGTNKRVAKEDRLKVQQEIVLNVVTLVDLTTAILPTLLKKNSGAIINIGSTASFQPVPGLAVYAATKAFVRSFTEALWAEVRGSKVKVLAIHPGATETEFFKVAGAKPAGKLAPVSTVVSATFKALESAKSGPSIVVGAANSLMAFSTRFAPKKIVLGVAAKLFLND